MKTRKLVMVTCLMAVMMFSQKAKAQTTIGAGLVYGTQIKSAGINAVGQFFVKDNIAIAPSFTYYFPKKLVGDFSLKWYEINADVNYYFNAGGNIKPYGLGGINVSIVSIPTFNFGGLFGGGGVGSGSTSVSRFGINLGGGADFDMGSGVTPFAQLKYTTSYTGQLAIEAGVRFKLK